jgi:2',3'-cyclic-nucleotide 2'-phosphodiesterase (5'-nucleotidase family)
MPDRSVTLHILHTNDFHSRLTDEGVRRLREAVADLNGAPYLLLDAGDAVKAGNIGVNPFGEPILDTMSDLGYHAMTMGNREFHVWEAALATKINRARFPVLCANLIPQPPLLRREGEESRGHWFASPSPSEGRANGERGPGGEVGQVRRLNASFLPVVPHIILPIGGVTVAVFGVTVPMVTARMKAAALSQFLFDDVVVAAKRQVLELRYRADILIALTHIGLPQDRKLAEAVPGIDLIIGGHSHNTLTEPEIVNGIPIVQTGSHARHFGHCRVDYSRDGVALDYHLFPLQEKQDDKTK